MVTSKTDANLILNGDFADVTNDAVLARFQGNWATYSQISGWKTPIGQLLEIQFSSNGGTPSRLRTHSLR